MEKPDMKRTHWRTNEAENFYCMLKLTRHKINKDICDMLTSHRN